VLEYIDESHTYLVDGIIVPSVTQLLHRKFNKKYDGISAEVLNKAAVRGTRIHKDIEEYCRLGKEPVYSETKDFIFVTKKNGLTVKENEIPIILDLGGETFAGRLDLILEAEGELAVADIKTTATLDKEYLAYQLNLYRLGAMQSYGYDIKRLYGIHLKNGTRKAVPIPIKEAAWLEESLNIQEA
jgi:hypothetical protein